MNRVVLAIMENDDLPEAEAYKIFREMRYKILYDAEDPEEVLMEQGIDPRFRLDLIEDLM